MSSRYASAVIVLALLALGPTVVHNYLGRTVDDGLRAERLSVVVPGTTASATPKGRDWYIGPFGTDDGYEREYRDASGNVVRLNVIRTADAKAVFHHPEIVVAYGQPLHVHDLVRMPRLPGVTVHRLLPDGPRHDRMALYALWSNGQWVDDPMQFQVRSAATALFRGRLPMTLVFVQTRKGMPGNPDVGLEADVLAGAVAAIEATRDAARGR